jgi:Flp pilus assembly protein TadG
MTRGRPPRYGWDEGATAVELALILSLLMMLMVGIMEFAVGFWRWNTMLIVVQDVGRYVMIKSGDGISGNTCDADCAKQQLADRLTEASSTCGDPANPSAGQMCVDAIVTAGTPGDPTATPPVLSTPATMVLSATYGFNFLTSSPFRLTASTTVPME